MVVSILRNTQIVVIGIAILIGVIFNGFFPFMFLATATFIAMVLTVIGFIIDLIAKSTRGIRITGMIFIFFLTATLSCLASVEVSRSLAEKQGNKVIKAVYTYKSQYGHFPKNIASLNIDSRLRVKLNKQQSYWTDSTLSKFELTVHSDGWHWTAFRSKDSTWVTED